MSELVRVLVAASLVIALGANVACTSAEEEKESGNRGYGGSGAGGSGAGGSGAGGSGAGGSGAGGSGAGGAGAGGSGAGGSGAGGSGAGGSGAGGSGGGAGGDGGAGGGAGGTGGVGGGGGEAPDELALHGRGFDVAAGSVVIAQYITEGRQPEPTGTSMFGGEFELLFTGRPYDTGAQRFEYFIDENGNQGCDPDEIAASVAIPTRTGPGRLDVEVNPPASSDATICGIWPATPSFSVTVTGSGFDLPDGTTVVGVLFDPIVILVEGRVTGSLASGNFSLQLTGLEEGKAYDLLVYLDADASGACNDGDPHFRIAVPAVSGNVQESITPASPTSVCGRVD